AAKTNYSTIALNFMPEKFTLSELQRVYEIIMGTDLDKRNFRKRVQAIDGISDTGEIRRNGKHRPARLYTYASTG
ncbi:MAG: NUDIX hydrolase, partial [Gammaproteobacteria bacterium]|nr:NUDIX hydrolase [Gammaproteobacteria bacterium]NIO63386.1 NUDIX hydrolase [Gammaproteobacteria bacterium]